MHSGVAFFFSEARNALHFGGSTSWCTPKLQNYITSLQYCADELLCTVGYTTRESEMMLAVSLVSLSLVVVVTCI